MGSISKSREIGIVNSPFAHLDDPLYVPTWKRLAELIGHLDFLFLGDDPTDHTHFNLSAFCWSDRFLKSLGGVGIDVFADDRSAGLYSRWSSSSSQ